MVKDLSFGFFKRDPHRNIMNNRIEDHVHRPRQFNRWCLNGVWLCALLQILIYTMSEPVKRRERQLSRDKQLRDKPRD
jgi:hypothetical protein